jgi:hypothetical protein
MNLEQLTGKQCFGLSDFRSGAQGRRQRSTGNDLLEQAQREGLIQPAYNELGVRIGWSLTRRGRRQQQNCRSWIAVLGWVFCGLLLAVVMLFALGRVWGCLGAMAWNHSVTQLSWLEREVRAMAQACCKTWPAGRPPRAQRQSFSRSTSSGARRNIPVRSYTPSVSGSGWL